MHHFVDFKSFRRAKIGLLRPLTILIGPNGSGKSNALEGIEVLAAIAAGHRLREITDLDREGVLNVRGGLQGCTRHGSDSFTLEFSAHIRWAGSVGPFRYSATVTPLPEPRINAEALFFKKTMLFRTIEGSGSPTSADIRVEYNNFARGGRKPQVAVSATRSVLSQYEFFATKNRKRRVSLRLINGVRNHLRASFVFDPRPSAMRRYERIGHDVLLRDGSNLSSVLFGLRRNGTTTLDELFAQIRQVPDEPYSEFHFVTTELGDVVFGMREEHSGALSDARMLSDGTLRTLAVLTAVATAEPSSRVVVEEFDNGVHPSRVASVINAITKSSEERTINVLLSTHNPAVLNALTPDQQRNVVLAFRSNLDYSSQLVPLTSISRYDELLERGRLGDLVTRRIVDEYLDPDLEITRGSEMQKWLDGLGG